MFGLLLKVLVHKVLGRKGEMEMGLVNFWDVLKTGTGITAIIGGVGLLIVGGALVLSGQMGWAEFGPLALGIVTYVIGQLRSRFSTMKIEGKIDRAAK